MNVFGSFSYPIIIGYTLSGVFLLLIMLTTSKRFDAINHHVTIDVDSGSSSRIQRSIHYAFCIFDMGTTGYARRKQIYQDVDLLKHATTWDIILACSYCMLFILTSLICGLCLLCMISTAVIANILFIWGHKL